MKFRLYWHYKCYNCLGLSKCIEKEDVISFNPKKYSASVYICLQASTCIYVDDTGLFSVFKKCVKIGFYLSDYVIKSDTDIVGHSRQWTPLCTDITKTNQQLNTTCSTQSPFFINTIINPVVIFLLGSVGALWPGSEVVECDFIHLAAIFDLRHTLCWETTTYVRR